jgi:hypothetical protein
MISEICKSKLFVEIGPIIINKSRERENKHQQAKIIFLNKRADIMKCISLLASFVHQNKENAN